MTHLATKPLFDTASLKGRNGFPMAAARILSKKRECKSFPSVQSDRSQPMEVIQKIKSELEKSGSEAYFIGKRVEDVLAQVYFPTSY